MIITSTVLLLILLILFGWATGNNCCVSVWGDSADGEKFWPDSRRVGGFTLCWSGTSAPNAATWFLETPSRFCGRTVELDACLEGDKTPLGGTREWFNEPRARSGSSLPDEAAVTVRLWPRTRLAQRVTECTLTYSRTVAKETHAHTDSGIIIASSIVTKKTESGSGSVHADSFPSRGLGCSDSKIDRGPFPVGDEIREPIFTNLI